VQELLSRLCSIHKEKDEALRGGHRELDEVRVKLGKHLSEYKQILVGSGRSGKWSKLPRVAKIPGDRRTLFQQMGAGAVAEHR
jgi:hypothetical protein